MPFPSLGFEKDERKLRIAGDIFIVSSPKSTLERIDPENIDDILEELGISYDPWVQP